MPSPDGTARHPRRPPVVGRRGARTPHFASARHARSACAHVVSGRSGPCFLAGARGWLQTE
eukprot:4819835-Prymnesium_polylepis.1